MPYIGKEPVIGNFVKLDAISVVNGQAAYTMNNGGSAFTAYDNVNQFLVSLNGVLQAPTDSFTVSGSTLTFASNLATGDVIDFVIVLGNTLDVGTVSDNTVTAAKLASDIISGQTELASEPADTDEFLVSDAGVLKRIDYSLIKASPAMELLATTEASSDATVTFDGFFSSTYKNYLVVYSYVVPATNAQYLVGRYRVSASDVTTTYSTLQSRAGNTSANSDTGDQGISNFDTTSFPLSMSTVNTTAWGGASGYFYLHNPLDTTHYKCINGQSMNFQSTTQQYLINFAAVNRNSTSALSGFTFYFGSGNIASGNFKLYGIK